MNSDILGTNLNDELFGTDLADVIKGLFGNDRIYSGEGDDTVEDLLGGTRAFPGQQESERLVEIFSLTIKIIRTMSIDLDIFPTSPEYFYWGELKDKFLELLTPEDMQRLGKVSLCKLGSNEMVAEDTKISIPDDKNHNYYYLSLDIPNTLGMHICKNEPNYVIELDTLEDFGRNLDAVTIQTLTHKWKSVGYVYGVTSMAGRSKWEPPLFVALAAAIANLCQGYVIVMSDNFTLDVGVYTPEVFQQAEIKFSSQK